MSEIADFKNLLIPEIKAFCSAPIIEADQTGDKPTGGYATFKVTSPYGKDVGGDIPEEIGDDSQATYQLKLVESFKRVVSFTAYNMDPDASFDLAQTIHDWFKFYGYDFLDSNGWVVVSIADVTNRDAFIIEDYERRNGFDVTLRLSRELVREIQNIDQANLSNS